MALNLPLLSRLLVTILGISKKFSLESTSNSKGTIAIGVCLLVPCVIRIVSSDCAIFIQKIIGINKTKNLRKIGK